MLNNEKGFIWLTLHKSVLAEAMISSVCANTLNSLLTPELLGCPDQNLSVQL